MADQIRENHMTGTQFANNQIARCTKDGKHYTVMSQRGPMVAVYELCGREIHASNLRMVK